MNTTADEDVMKLLDAKLAAMGPVKLQHMTTLEWPLDLPFEKMTSELFAIVISRHQTALSTLAALKNEVFVLTEVIQDLM